MLGVSYDYDELNRLETIATSVNNTVISSHAYLYNLANQRTRATLVDGSYWEYSYDDLGQVTGGVKKQSNGTAIPGYTFGYTFDDIGNRKTFTENAQVTSYITNLLNQYSSIDRPAVAFLRGDRANTNTTITVDLLGDGLGPQAATPTNLLWYYTQAITDLVSQFEVIATEGGNSNSSIGSLYTPNGAESPQYDLDGNLTRDHLWNYTWDSENQLVAQEHRSDVTITPLARKRMEYSYDSQGRRVQRKTFQDNNGNWVLQEDLRFIWDRWNLLAEFDANNVVIRSYIWGLDLSGSMQGAGGVGGLLSVDNGTTVALPVFDGNGNVMGYTNSATGTLVAQYEYDPFGRRIRKQGPQADVYPHRFSTKHEENETGFLYYVMRYYDPETGRWPNRDPIGERGGVNLYVFVHNLAPTAWDYLGLDTYIIVVGKDIDKKEGHLQDKFNKAGDLQESAIKNRADYSHTDDKVVKLTSGMVSEFVKALKDNERIVEIVFFVHGGRERILFDGHPPPGTDFKETQITVDGGATGGASKDSYGINELPTENLTANLVVKIYGCKTRYIRGSEEDEKKSIAEALAEQYKEITARILSSDVGVDFTKHGQPIIKKWFLKDGATGFEWLFYEDGELKHETLHPQK